ncbi:type II secretion system protein N [Pseudomonas tohonis]|uniref:type II secretion system protein N n=1 Tax=Pseudomonas tohonis TaxID=2725477 RepID=UPI001F3B06A7|nr:type II secretion system protein N [Pseudomonas tohonis]
MRLVSRFNPAACVQGAALAATLAGLVTWGLLLGDPRPQQAQALSQAPQPAPAAAREAAQWFASRASQLDVRLTGLFAGERGAVAILAIDDAPPRAFLTGESLGEGVRLDAIEGDAVIIARGGETQRLSIARLPEAPPLPSLR